VSAVGDSPHIVILSGPNGAGKSTAAPALLPGVLGIAEFVNADTIARGLSEFDPESKSLAAGRIMLRQLHELVGARASFAFETTLASRSFAVWLRPLLATGYQLTVFYLWLSAPEIAVDRVRDRVASGGHHIPENVIRRRYERGISNFFAVYQPLATGWFVYDNSLRDLRLIAHGRGDETEVVEQATWARIRAMAR
jgi:predicted ABC-type ATPase